MTKCSNSTWNTTACVASGPIPSDRWPFVAGELARVTTSGGWVESVETTPPEGGGPAMDQIIAWLAAALAGRGVDLNYGGKVGELLGATGPVQMMAYRVPLPMGAHGGRIGRLLAMDYFAVVKGLSGMLAAQGIASAPQIEHTLAMAQRDVDSSRFRCVAPFYVTFGQRV
jgi:hypothetical protein